MSLLENLLELEFTASFGLGVRGLFRRLCPDSPLWRISGWTDMALSNP